MTGRRFKVQTKCIGDNTKAAARQSLNRIKNKENKIWRKMIFDMADRILTPCNDHDIDFAR